MFNSSGSQIAAFKVIYMLYVRLQCAPPKFALFLHTSVLWEEEYAQTKSAKLIMSLIRSLLK